MAEPSIPRGWKIISSTSRFFPVDSEVRFAPVRGGVSRYELDVDWGRQATSWTFEVELPDGMTSEGRSSHFHGDFQDKKGRPFRVVFTLCPESSQGGPRYLCGLLFHRRNSDPGDLGDTATGVWVAEEERKEPAEEK